MHQPDATSPYYQYYQSSYQTPNSIPTPASTAFASAPPVASSSDYSNYAPFPPNYDHAPAPVPNTIPVPNPSLIPPPPPPSSSSYLSPNPNSNHNYSFPHLDPNSAAYHPYDRAQSTASNYDYNANSNLNPSYDYNSLSSTGSYSLGSYSSASYSAPQVPSYDNSHDNNGNYGGYGEQGVYKYIGGKTDAGYGGREGRSAMDSSGSVLFDDYGRPINVANGRELSGSRSSAKIMKAAPRVEEQTDVKSGVQKYRVKLLSEGFGQTDMDVLCQIGLDGIRILEPSTSRTLKIYPLETVTRWEVLDSYIFAFWAKTSVDFEPRRIRLKSNSYTTNNILDTVTAASIQVKEIGSSGKPSDSPKVSEQPGEKKKGLADWMNLMKPGNEEKDHWVPDEAVSKCTACGTAFNAFIRRHHCRNCGDVFCDKCTQGRIALTVDEQAQPVRVCDQCMAEVTQRLSNAKEAAVRVTGQQSHEDLARKLQEEMNKNRKTSSGTSSGGSGSRMREVACPTCTVHLQVQVPASGSETIECSVCQHPFLFSAD